MGSSTPTNPEKKPKPKKWSRRNKPKWWKRRDKYDKLHPPDPPFEGD